MTLPPDAAEHSGRRYEDTEPRRHDVEPRRHDDPPRIEPESQGWRAWLLGASFTIAVALGAAGFSAQGARIAALELYGSPALRERIATNEARVLDLDRRQSADMQQIRETMRRIEVKLDTALDRLHSVKIPGYRPENVPRDPP